MFIDGDWVAAENSGEFQSINPATGTTVGSVPDGASADVENAIYAAHRAFHPWASLTAYQRAGFLYEAHALMMADLEKLASIMTEEQGKPIIRYTEEDELLPMANDTHYGLASYVYTQDLKKAFKLFEGLNFGIVGINDINPTSAAAPFGGMKESGIGREGSLEGLQEYLETKLVGLSI